MKNNKLLICFLALSLCFSGCAKKQSATTSSSSTSTSATETTEIPLGSDELSIVLDGKQKIGTAGTPFADETVKKVLNDPNTIETFDSTYGEGYHLAEHGFYMINLQNQCIQYGFLYIPVIRNGLIIGFVTISSEIPGQATCSFDPGVEDPDYPSDPTFSYLGTINETLKEHPDEHFIWLINGSEEFLLDSKNELHCLKPYGMEDITIENQDTLYSAYYFEEATISADMITPD